MNLYHWRSGCQSSDELVQGFLVIKACCYQSLVDIFAREANLRDLLEWPEMFSADILLGVVEDAHVLTSFYTESLIHQSEQLKYDESHKNKEETSFTSTIVKVNKS